MAGSEPRGAGKCERQELRQGGIWRNRKHIQRRRGGAGLLSWREEPSRGRRLPWLKSGVKSLNQGEPDDRPALSKLEKRRGERQ